VLFNFPSGRKLLFCKQTPVNTNSILSGLVCLGVKNQVGKGDIETKRHRDEETKRLSDEVHRWRMKNAKVKMQK